MTSISSLPTGGAVFTPFAKGEADAGNAQEIASGSDAGPAVIISLLSGKSAAAAAGPKDFASVAADARSTLDAGYRKLGKGATEVYQHGDMASWQTAFGGMDRRSLYAVASNQGNQFTAEERDMARSLMAKQQGDAMALGSADPAAGYKAGIAFLDSVSAEEKGSFDWALQRAAVQFGYESAMSQSGREPEKIDSESPLVKMLKAAMDALKALNDPSKRLEDMPQYQQAKEFSASGASSDGAGHLVDVTV